MNPINDLSQLSREAIAEFKKVAGAPMTGDDLAKAGITQATGLTWYDLQKPSKNLFPVLTPLRNKIPRVGAAGGTATNWKAVTAINSLGLQGFVPEGTRNGLVTTATEDKSATYRSLGMEDSVTFEADLAADFSEASPFPTPDDIQKDVYWETDNPSQRTSSGRLFFT